MGYLDFRGYSGTQFFNTASLDVVVDGTIPFTDGGQVPTKMRFAVSNDQTTFIPMELNANGRLEIGALLAGGGYAGLDLLENPGLFVNKNDNNWSTVFAARPDSGPGFALRVDSLGETENDYLIGGSSGSGNGSFKFSVRGNGNVIVGGDLLVQGTN